MQHKITGERHIIRIVSYNITVFNDFLNFFDCQAALEHALHRVSTEYYLSAANRHFSFIILLAKVKSKGVD